MDAEGLAICLVSPGHLASNPRLVKEADALHAAGFRVRVVAADYMNAVRPLDEAILATAPWEFRRVSLGGGLLRRLRALRRRVCSWLVDRGVIPGISIALWAESDLIGKLTAAALEKPAALYIAHNLPALAAAAGAARVLQRRSGIHPSPDAHMKSGDFSYHGGDIGYGFDAEDCHVDELADEPGFRGRRAAREKIERTFLSECRHLTAASPGIGDELKRRYGVQPLTVLNVFPLKDAPSAPENTPFQTGSGPPSFYWFSQTIGPWRGLEQIIAAMGRMKTPAHLHLQGFLHTGFGIDLDRAAKRAGMVGRLHLHEPALPHQLAHLAARHDLGLALELTGGPPNRELCLSNKIFTYLLAGTPMLMSRTPAQERLAADLEDAALVHDIDDPVGLAACLDSYLTDSQRQRSARQCAWRLGQERYNWDFEQHSFLDSVRRALGVEKTCAS